MTVPRPRSAASTRQPTSPERAAPGYLPDLIVRHDLEPGSVKRFVEAFDGAWLARIDENRGDRSTRWRGRDTRPQGSPRAGRSWSPGTDIHTSDVQVLYLLSGPHRG